MRLSKARKEIVTAVMKDTIFQAASSVLEQHGVGGLTMERVANTVGLATGSLYNYFQDKSELVQFVYMRLVEPFFQELDEIDRSERPAVEKLEKLVRMALDYSARNKGLIRLLAGSEQESQLRRSVHPRARRIYANIFARGVEEGTFVPHDPDHASRLLQGSLSELFEMRAEGVANDDVERYAEMLLQAVHRGFGALAAGDAAHANY
jgi:AcrR family transcriptional regulator